MASKSGPWGTATAGGIMYQDDWSAMLSRVADGVYGTPNSTDLLVTANSSGMTVTMQPGQELHGGQWHSEDTATSLTITANGSGAVRIDRIVTRRDSAAGTILPVVIAGTAGGPVPAILATDSFKAQVTVDPGVTSIAAGKVKDERRFVGERVALGTALNRPPGVNGRLLHETDTGRWLYWNGSAYVQLTPNVVQGYTPAVGVFDSGLGRFVGINLGAQGYARGRFRLAADGRTGWVAVELLYGPDGSMVANGNGIIFGLPFTPAPLSGPVLAGGLYGGSPYQVRAVFGRNYPSAGAYMLIGPGTASSVGFLADNTWDKGQIIVLSGEMEL